MAVPPRGPPRVCMAYATYTMSAARNATTVPVSHGRCVRSMRMALLRNGLAGDHVFEKLIRIHAMRRIVRAGVNAAGFGVVCAEIARCCLLFGYHGSLTRRIGTIDVHLERVQRDVAIGAVLCA